MSQFTHPISYTDERPWGRFTILDQGDGYQVKRIEVLPGKRLSLQSHQYRSEVWTVVAGVLDFELDGVQNKISQHETVFIGTQQKHRAGNSGTEILVFIEVQKGTYLGEDDIIRYEDDHGRI